MVILLTVLFQVWVMLMLHGWALLIPGIYLWTTRFKGRLLRPMRTYAVIHFCASGALFAFSIWCSIMGGHQEAEIMGFCNVLLNCFFAVVYVMVLVSRPPRRS